MSEEFSNVLRAAKAGNGAALAELIDRGSGTMDRVLRCRMNRFLRRRYDTADLRQSVVLEILKDLPRFEDRGEDAFLSWLAIKAVNKLRKKFRGLLTRDGKPHEVELPDDSSPFADSSPLLASLRNEEIEELRRVLDRLPEHSRRILLLRNSERMTFGEISDRIGLPGPDAARKQYVRALLKLRSEWKKTSKPASSK